MPNTRERILMLLLSRSYTVEELAREISVSKNAVRAQIAILEREGLVEIQGSFRSARRPAARYGLGPGSDLHFSKAYPVVLADLVRVLAQRLPEEEFLGVMRELGRRLASSAPRPSGNPRERIQGALTFLKALGSQGQAAEEGNKVILTSPVCPIARAVAADSRVCASMETLLQELTGYRVEEHCQRGERQACRFTIRVPVDKTKSSGEKRP